MKVDESKLDRMGAAKKPQIELETIDDLYDLPSTEQLAIIAAHLMGVTKSAPKMAAAKAAELWDACEKENLRIRKQAEALLESDNAELDKYFAEQNALSRKRQENSPTPKDLGLARPKKDTLTFNELLRWLMPSVRRVGDRLARYRRYLVKVNGLSLEDAGSEIAKLKMKRFEMWDLGGVAKSYLKWWNAHLRSVKRQAGKKGRNSPRRKRQSTF